MTTTILGPSKSWRLIHDGTSVILLEEMSGLTTTTHIGFEAQTVAECVTEAKRLGLFVPQNLEQLFAFDSREAAKAIRQAAVENIKVTTAAGNTFDGDEVSQTRMSRAILVLSTARSGQQPLTEPSVPWILADNTTIQATQAELTEALALAGAEQARIWVSI